MFSCNINYLDSVLSNQTLIIKRSPIYLYKTFFWFLLLGLSVGSTFYISYNLSGIFIVINYIYIFFILIWTMLMFLYLFTYNTNFKTYYLLSDKNILIKDRVRFRLFFYTSLVLLLLTFIFNLLSVTTFFLTIIGGNTFDSFRSFIFYLFAITFFLLIALFFKYLIIKRFYNLEVDLIIFSKNGIKKEIHNSFFYIYPYFLDIKDIGDINIIFKGILGNLFDVGSIAISSNNGDVRHYNYLKNPSEIYEVILKLIKSK